jgi:hypothetical protein
VGLGGRIEVRQGGSTSHECTSSSGIDGHRLHPAEIDLEAVIDHAAPGGAVCPAPNRDFQILLAGEADRGADVSSIRAANDDRRPPVDGAVPDDASLVVPGVVRDEQLSGDRRPQGLHMRAGDLCHVNLLLRLS